MELRDRFVKRLLRIKPAEFLNVCTMFQYDLHYHKSDATPLIFLHYWDQIFLVPVAFSSRQKVSSTFCARYKTTIIAYKCFVFFFFSPLLVPSSFSCCVMVTKQKWCVLTPLWDKAHHLYVTSCHRAAITFGDSISTMPCASLLAAPWWRALRRYNNYLRTAMRQGK